jgi:hypothetical protein
MALGRTVTGSVPLYQVTFVAWTFTALPVRSPPSADDKGHGVVLAAPAVIHGPGGDQLRPGPHVPGLEGLPEVRGVAGNEGRSIPGPSLRSDPATPEASISAALPRAFASHTGAEEACPV